MRYIAVLLWYILRTDYVNVSFLDHWVDGDILDRGNSVSPRSESCPEKSNVYILRDLRRDVARVHQNGLKLVSYSHRVTDSTGSTIETECNVATNEQTLGLYITTDGFPRSQQPVRMHLTSPSPNRISLICGQRVKYDKLYSLHLAYTQHVVILKRIRKVNFSGASANIHSIYSNCIYLHT